MDCTVAREGKDIRFTVSGKIDEQGAEELKARFLSSDRSSGGDAVFDFRGVTHIGSAGIGKLLLFYKELGVSGGTMRVENVSAAIYELFSLLKLDTLFRVSGSRS